MKSNPLSPLRVHAPAILACAFVPLFGLLIVVRGHDADWDFLNYHWYNAYAWLTDRRGFDVAVAHHATYYNPLADVPVYLAARIFPLVSAGWDGGALTPAMLTMAFIGSCPFCS